MKTSTPSNPAPRRLLTLGWLICVFWFFHLGVSIAAQDTDIRQLRAQLRKNLVSVILPEKKDQCDVLRDLEMRLSSAQDYQGAIRARDERLALEQEIATMEKELAALSRMPTRKLPERIPFKNSDAKLNLATFETSTGAISGWGKAGSTATWTLPDLPPGGYEILLTYSGESENVRLQESFYTLFSELPASGKKPREQNLGTLRIRDGKGTLTLSTNSPEQSSSLRVYSLVLLPASR